MKHFIYLLIITVTLSACHKFKRKDLVENEEKVAKKIPDGIQKNYNNGVLTSEATYKDGVKNGVAKNFYADGSINMEFNYKNNLKHGEFKWYYESGKLYKEANYVNGDKEGKETTYFENGNIRSTADYKAGMPGMGLVEYTNTGVKRKFPQIVVSTVDQIKLNNSYQIKVSLAKPDKKARFYIEDLIDGKYLPDYYIPLTKDNNGVGTFQLFVPEGTFIMKKINIIAAIPTKYKNTCVINKSFNLSVENRPM